MTAPDIATHIAGYGPEPRADVQQIPNLVTLLSDACYARDQALAQIAADEAFARALERSTPTYYTGPGSAPTSDWERARRVERDVEESAYARTHGWSESDEENDDAHE